MEFPTPPPPYFMKTPYIAYPSFLKFCPNPLLQLFCCLVSLAELVIVPHVTADVLFYIFNDIMDLHTGQV